MPIANLNPLRFIVTEALGFNHEYRNNLETWFLHFDSFRLRGVHKHLFPVPNRERLAAGVNEAIHIWHRTEDLKAAKERVGTILTRAGIGDPCATHCSDHILPGYISFDNKNPLNPVKPPLPASLENNWLSFLYRHFDGIAYRDGLPYLVMTRVVFSKPNTIRWFETEDDHTVLSAYLKDFFHIEPVGVVFNLVHCPPYNQAFSQKGVPLIQFSRSRHTYADDVYRRAMKEVFSSYKRTRKRVVEYLAAEG